MAARRAHAHRCTPTAEGDDDKKKERRATSYLTQVFPYQTRGPRQGPSGDRFPGMRRPPSPAGRRLRRRHATRIVSTPTPVLTRGHQDAWWEVDARNRCATHILSTDH